MCSSSSSPTGAVSPHRRCVFYEGFGRDDDDGDVIFSKNAIIQLK